MNLKMPALKAALEAAGFDDVKTLLASGNAVFGARRTSEAALARKVEAAIEQGVGKKFPTHIRSIDALQALLDSDPYREFRLPAQAKRVVTLLRDVPSLQLQLPIERDGARILQLRGRELLGAYLGPTGPVFMALIEKTCGKDITTRTWETLRKVARSAER